MEKQTFANQLALSGNLVEKPSIRFIGEKTCVIRLRIAQNQGYYSDESKTTWIETETLFFEFEAWGETAQAIEAMGLEKGDKIIIKRSKLEPNTWTNKEGRKITSLRGKIFVSSDVEIVSTLADRRALKQANDTVASEVDHTSADIDNDDLPF